jgi:hypothetical protein
MCGRYASFLPAEAMAPIFGTVAARAVRHAASGGGPGGSG